MSPRVLLHIGFHKTGSSAIQANLQEFSPAYRNRGLEIPAGLSSWTGHPEVAWACSAERFPWADRHFRFDIVHEYYATLIAHLPPGHTMLLSSEEFCRLNYFPGAIQAVHKFFEGCRVEVVAYVRDPLDFLVSRYRHELTYGEALTLHEFILEHLGSADFPARLAPWIEVFGADRVHVRPFDREQFDGGSVVEDFMRSIAVEPESSQFRPGEFAGAHPWLCTAWQQLNRCDTDEATRNASQMALHAAAEALPDASAGDYLLKDVDLDDFAEPLAAIRSGITAMLPKQDKVVPLRVRARQVLRRLVAKS